MTQKIVLIRHGRSAHVAKGLLDRAAFLQWREAYEAAGIDAMESAPAELMVEARNAGMIVSSDVQRAIESAHVLADGRDVITSRLLRELALQPPSLRWIRLPLFGWALLFGVRWLFRRTHATPDEALRVRAAAQWLNELSERHGEVVVVTHGMFRSLVARELAQRGWTPAIPKRSSAHWSAWSLTIAAERIAGD